LRGGGRRGGGVIEAWCTHVGGKRGRLEKEMGEGVEKECDDEYSWCMQFSRAFS